MKKNLMAAGVFLLGLGLGGVAAGASNWTREQSDCVWSCVNDGGVFAACRNCCVDAVCGE